MPELSDQRSLHRNALCGIILAVLTGVDAIEPDLAVFEPAKATQAQWFTVDQHDNDVAVTNPLPALQDDDIPAADTGFRHRVIANLQGVAARAVQQALQPFALLIVNGFQRKASRDAPEKWWQRADTEQGLQTVETGLGHGALFYTCFRRVFNIENKMRKNKLIAGR